MTVGSWVEILTQAGQLRGECANLFGSRPSWQSSRRSLEVKFFHESTIRIAYRLKNETELHELLKVGLAIRQVDFECET